MIELTVLGSGTAIPSPERGSPGYLVQAGKRSILMDCGPGSLRAAAAAGVSPAEIDAVLLTHFHPDHTQDLQALLFCLRNSELFKDLAPLEIVAPRGFREVLEHWQSGPQGDWLTPRGLSLDLREIQEGSHEIAGLALEAIHVDHTPESLAYRLSEGPDGPVLAYSGDTGPCEGIVRVGREARVFVLECAQPDGNPWKGHLTPRLAGEIAAAARPELLVLTHFYPEVVGEPIEEIVAEFFDGRLERARDGTTYKM